MGFVDLHVHSNASDGTLAPADVVCLAVSQGLSAMALTDHDTAGGVPEALLAADGLPIEIIPGIELSCVYQDTEIHILGLYIDINDGHFREETKRLLKIREDRNDKILRRLCQAGIVITREDLTKDAPDTVITRAHFARVLTEKGIVPSREAAFKQYLNYGGPYCPRKEAITPEQAMAALTGCGAFAALAHPYQYKLGDGGTEKLIIYLKQLGLKGVEVWHSSNNPYESGKLKDMARRHGLLPTGGSDFHGGNKPDIQIGTGRGGLRVPDLILSDIKACLHPSTSPAPAHNS